MARNLKFYLDESGNPCARGPQTETVLMKFLEIEINSNDHICHDLMEDMLAIESEAASSREFQGKLHTVTINTDGVEIQAHQQPAGDLQNPAAATPPGTPHETIDQTLYRTGRKHFREIIEDWEAFILDETE